MYPMEILLRTFRPDTTGAKPFVDTLGAARRPHLKNGVSPCGILCGSKAHGETRATSRLQPQLWLLLPQAVQTRFPTTNLRVGQTTPSVPGQGDDLRLTAQFHSAAVPLDSAVSSVHGQRCTRDS